MAGGLRDLSALTVMSLGRYQESRHPSEGWDPVLSLFAKELDSSLRWNDEQEGSPRARVAVMTKKQIVESMSVSNFVHIA